MTLDRPFGKETPESNTTTTGKSSMLTLSSNVSVDKSTVPTDEDSTLKKSVSSILYIAGSFSYRISDVDGIIARITGVLSDR